VQDLGLRAATYMIWGAGTDVGKTLVSCGICNTASLRNKSSPGSQVLYYKPIQTGFPQDSDADQVASVCGAGVVSELGYHAAELNNDEVADFPNLVGGDKPHGTVVTRTEYAWTDPVSPHLAVQMQGRPVQDEEIVQAVGSRLNQFFDEAAGKNGSLALVETAGAVLSPAPSGRVQADVMRDLRLPGILVGDGRIGGISNTLCALESLMIRGFDVTCVIMLDMGLKNDEAVRAIIEKGAYGLGKPPPPVFVLPPIPKRRSSVISESSLKSWFNQSDAKFVKVVKLMHTAHAERVSRLANAKEQARDVLWWPFTQHGNLSPTDVGVIDSRQGEHWAVYKTREEAGDAAGETGILSKMFDGSGSWWTCGMDARTHPIMTRAIAYAAGRFGHVLFPQQVHRPALELAKKLVAGPGSGWATRVFYSDNGSTAVEVAIKMAFRKYMKDHGLLGMPDGELSRQNFVVMALEGSYHGDTLGVMNAQSPSVFTGPRQFAWYQPKGHFVDPPTLSLSDGRWAVALPKDMNVAVAEGASWESRTEALDIQARLSTPLAEAYAEHARGQLAAASAAGGRVGALLLEAVMHGAGGMVLIDPLYQHVLARECRAQGVPVVLDEIFSGIWRLGRIAAASIPAITPDISCFAKLLTGGTVPLAVTLASEPVYASFLGDTKAEALLHGHSYTAHAIGCQVAIASLDCYADKHQNDNFRGVDQPLAEQWDPAQMTHISRLPRVKRVAYLGTVAIVEVKSEGTGYEAQGAIEIVRKLRPKGVAARPLGNVVYLMATPTTTPATCKALLKTLTELLT